MQPSELARMRRTYLWEDAKGWAEMAGATLVNGDAWDATEQGYVAVFVVQAGSPAVSGQIRMTENELLGSDWTTFMMTRWKEMMRLMWQWMNLDKVWVES